MKHPKTEKISFRVGEDDYNRLDAEANRQRIPLATYVRKVLGEHLDGREDSEGLSAILSEQKTRK